MKNPKAQKTYPHLGFLAAVQQDILAQVATMRAFAKAEVTGALFEELIRQTVNDILPSSLRAVPGIIVNRSGNPSSHFDCLIVDTSSPISGRRSKQIRFGRRACRRNGTYSRLDKCKLKLIDGKAKEIDKLNQAFPERSAGERVSFVTLATDSFASRDEITVILDEWISGDIHLMRHQGSSFHYWLESSSRGVDICERETEALLADLLLMMTQDLIGIIERRRQSRYDVSLAMNDAIHWGKSSLKTRPQRRKNKRREGI